MKNSLSKDIYRFVNKALHFSPFILQYLQLRTKVKANRQK